MTITALKYFFILTSLLFLVVNGVCQNSRSVRVESGLVVSEKTNSPVESATVFFLPGMGATTTNEQGSFLISQTIPGVDSILIVSIGHETARISYREFIGNGRIVHLKIQPMEMSAIKIYPFAAGQYKLISKIDIAVRGISNSQDVLRLVPGLFTGQHAGGGKAEQIFLRGFDLDHGTDINISLDGMPVNMVSHAHGQGYADLHFVIPELIENVSFKKGSYSAEKGNLATAGHVDFKTKNALPANMVKFEAGQFHSYRAVAMVNLLKKTEKKQFSFIAAEHMFTNGYFDDPQNFNRFNLFAKYKRKIGKKNDLSFSVSTFYSKWKAPGQIPERALQGGLIGFFGAVDPNEGGNTSRSNFNLQVHSVTTNGDYFRNQVYFTKYDFDLYSNFTFFLNDSVNGDQIRQKEIRDLFGYNGSYSHIAYAADRKFTTEAGLNVRIDKTNNSELSRTRDKKIITQRIKLGDIKEMNAGIWLTETIHWNKRLTVNAGLRYDQVSNSYLDKPGHDKNSRSVAGIVSPKLNFYYQLNNKTQFYLTTGKGFHSNDTRVTIQTADKKALTAAYGADLGVMLKTGNDLLVQSALWYLKLDQEFVYVGDAGVVEPGGQSRRFGLDLSVRYQPVKWLFLDADANYSNGRAIGQPKGKDLLPLAPVFTSAGGVGYKNANGLSGSLRYRLMGDRPANEDNSIVAKGYFITDAIVTLTKARFEAGIAVQNLFDLRWKETQFNTESKLKHEHSPVTEIHFTPGTPLFCKVHFSLFF
jgi:hypothetical protein